MKYLYHLMAILLVQALLTNQASALGVDELAGKHIGYMVTDDMLLNADKDPNNWLLLRARL